MKSLITVQTRDVFLSQAEVNRIVLGRAAGLGHVSAVLTHIAVSNHVEAVLTHTIVLDHYPMC